MDKAILEKIKKIDVVLTDVDGVLTDGGLYYTADGLVMKKFQVKDGMGVRRLRDAGFKTGMITTDTSEFVKLRAERVKMDYVYMGIWKKQDAMNEICKELGKNPENIAFIGDDENDLTIMAEAGFTVCPADAVDNVKDAVDMVLSKKGGEGVFRELAELLLKYK